MRKLTSTRWAKECKCSVCGKTKNIKKYVEEKPHCDVCFALHKEKEESEIK